MKSQNAFSIGAGLVCAIAIGASSLAAPASAATVNIPNPAGGAYDFFGSGDASVTYDNVTFSTSAALGDGNFYNVGPAFSGNAAVVSDQQASSGLENILITLPQFTKAFSLNYGTFDGSAVEFTLSNGATFSAGSTGSGYGTPDFQSFSSTPFDTVLLTTQTAEILNVSSVTYGGVPEPTTWAFMLVGFAGLGAAMRATRRQQAALAA